MLWAARRKHVENLRAVCESVVGYTGTSCVPLLCSLLAHTLCPTATNPTQSIPVQAWGLCLCKTFTPLTPSCSALGGHACRSPRGRNNTVSVPLLQSCTLRSHCALSCPYLRWPCTRHSLLPCLHAYARYKALSMHHPACLFKHPSPSNHHLSGTITQATRAHPLLLSKPWLPRRPYHSHGFYIIHWGASPPGSYSQAGSSRQALALGPGLLALSHTP